MVAIYFKILLLVNLLIKINRITGQTGSAVIYTVPGGKYVSTKSQADYPSNSGPNETFNIPVGGYSSIEMSVSPNGTYDDYLNLIS
ncbi:DUF5977 domain-containing protein [Pedobacter hiemivivus]|uniref:DUF5977 domain-containing protein n=1 Tax=Pedobacter hiemivivus TaxID=2530454 RepID=A0A4R0NFC9_9SPHI|nr:hypothetical protein [Pedobacter hiemivivus]TCC99189.1 hypothetical protein EZ444_00465 [Pedobacter hiemivivus]